MAPRPFYDAIPREYGVLEVVATGSHRLRLTFVDCLYAKAFIENGPSWMKEKEFYFKFIVVMRDQLETKNKVGMVSAYIVREGCRS